MNIFRRSSVWVPQYKWQLVEVLGNMYPGDKAKFSRMTKERLYAIYFSATGMDEGR